MGKSRDETNHKRYLINKIISKNSSAVKPVNNQEQATGYNSYDLEQSLRRKMKELEVLEQQKALWQNREPKENYQNEYESAKVQNLNSSDRE